jgi:SAM-dependent methyltransferase
MRLTEIALRRIRAQFGHPNGFWGPVAGWIMVLRSSNRRRNVWAVSLLNIERHDRVLEIGFGPGIAIQEINRIAVEGYVCGLDHSERMLKQASRRNASAIDAGRVELRLGPVERLPEFHAPFDKVLSVNSLMFWTQPDLVLEQLRHVMRAGARIGIAHQPRGPGASDATAAATGRQLAAALERAGFSDVRIETLMLKPAAVCAIGVNPHADSTASAAI